MIRYADTSDRRKTYHVERTTFWSKDHVTDRLAREFWAHLVAGFIIIGGVFSGCTTQKFSTGRGGSLAKKSEIPVDSLTNLRLPGPEMGVGIVHLPRANMPVDRIKTAVEKKTSFLEKLRAHLLGSGHASYYGHNFAGRPTASGERFNPEELTAAHRTLPFGSLVRVTNLENGKSVVVRINDRGPFTRRRIIDLSYAAAKLLGMVRAGKAPVELELLPEPITREGG